MIKRLTCHTQILSSVGVLITNGDKIWVQEICKIERLLQTNDSFVLPLMRCDLVLGVQWLRELEPIVCDFKRLTMQFTIQKQQFILHGMRVGDVQVATKK